MTIERWAADNDGYAAWLIDEAEQEPQPRQALAAFAGAVLEDVAAALAAHDARTLASDLDGRRADLLDGLGVNETAPVAQVADLFAQGVVLRVTRAVRDNDTTGLDAGLQELQRALLDSAPLE